MTRTLERTDAKIVAMIRDLSGPLACDLIATYDIDEPTQLDGDSLREALVGAYLDGDIAGDVIVAAWEDVGAPAGGFTGKVAASKGETG